MEKSPLMMIILFVMIFPASVAGGGGVYWGQDGAAEGTLASACSTDIYSHIILASLTNFGSGRVPLLNLTAHCDLATNACTNRMSNDVRFCQNRGIKVLLSIGGSHGNYSLASKDDAKNVSLYLWNNFLGGQSQSRPLGDAVLDGVELMIQQGPDLYYDNLVVYLSNYTTNASAINGKAYLLGAANRCPPPGTVSMGTAVSTGLFDFVSIQLYSPNSNRRACDYNGNITDFTNSWGTWTATIPSGKIFLGLPAAPQVAETGFIPANVLKSDIIPMVQKSSKYGGVMLWSKFWDDRTGYTTQITTSVR